MGVWGKPFIILFLFLFFNFSFEHLFTELRLFQFRLDKVGRHRFKLFQMFNSFIFNFWFFKNFSNYFSILFYYKLEGQKSFQKSGFHDFFIFCLKFSMLCWSIVKVRLLKITIFFFFRTWGPLKLFYVYYWLLHLSGVDLAKPPLIKLLSLFDKKQKLLFKSKKQ